MHGRFEGIPAFLNEVDRSGFGRTFDRSVMNDPVATARCRTTFHRNNRRPRALGKGHMRLRYAREEPAKAINRHAAFARIEIEIAEHSKFSTRLQVFEHADHRAFLRDDFVARALPEAVKNGAEERVTKALGDDRTGRNRVGTDKREPLEIRKMETGINRRLRGILPAVIAAPSLEDNMSLDKRPRHVGSPEKFEHRSCKRAVGTEGDPQFLRVGIPPGKCRLDIGKGDRATSRITPTDESSKEVSDRSKCRKRQPASDSRRCRKAEKFCLVAEARSRAHATSMRGKTGVGSPS